ncbi:ImmA/IrrE family metallo-endopeptidase [Kangiella koreensis]|uniref:IrrE N-terminal-like domain-containing protein n=1 Tax=Kangiella koreensis (strain DSM 16069 / JCM 12317 / KCTC 12182 / SW-125) TaxID=523791 RepID=C7R642_KANKD|nr:ImmA/IrrE family metallo-endopeptidase [Kangiella koreensis]ACV25473.1 protein of unknown function DUF955 [Kangiella koreensis DSM 16069]
MINPEHIIEFAEGLAEQHKGKSGGGDPFIAFNDYEVPVAQANFNDAFEGLLRFHDEEFQVFINTGSAGVPRTIGRCRFTGAHEFGHFSISEHRNAIMLGDGFHKDITGFSSRNPMEREADIFAAHFLVPTKALQKRYRNQDWGAKEIIDAARHFETSITCAALRCQSSLPGNSALVLWGPTHVRWQKMDYNWWFELPAKSIKNADELIPGSATEELLRGGVVPECGYLSRGTTRSAWFKRVANWSARNTILLEQAIPLGDYGCLTILRPDSV